MTDTTPQPTTNPLPQGDLGLLETESARQLLASTIPARLAYTATDGTPRVIPTWFHWTGSEFVLPTFIAAPHVQHAATRLSALRARPAVALTIDTEQFPPVVLSVRGAATITEHSGVVAEYALSAHRYMGNEAATDYLAFLDDPKTVMARIAVVPTWVGLIDFQTRLPDTLGGVIAAT
jgi:hypothetical protein